MKDTILGLVTRGSSDPAGGWGILVLVRGFQAAPFDQAELDRVEALLPHVRRAVSAGLRLGAAMAERDALAAALDRLTPRGAMLVDASGRVAFASAAAEAILASPGSPLARARHGALVASPRAPSAAQAQLDRLLALAAGVGDGPREGGSGRFPATSPGGQAVTLEVLPFNRSTTMGGALALVLIEASPATTASVPLPSVKILQERWSLTPAEAGVALLLAKRGTGSKALARELGVSPTTVRTHLQRTLEKTGTHSRAGLVALLLHGISEPE